LIPGIDCEIIFVTAHDNYAVDAFELSATGYILKPIDDQELSQAVDKALERVQFRKIAKIQPGIRIQPIANDGKIAIPGNHGIDYINISEILYLESTNKCTRIATLNQEYISTSNIGKFQYLIDNFSFFQIHRSFIINIRYVLRYDSLGFIIMNNKKEIPISRSAKSDFLQMFSIDQ
jgi:two-component system LytT family response regulator